MGDKVTITLEAREVKLSRTGSVVAATAGALNDQVTMPERVLHLGCYLARGTFIVANRFAHRCSGYLGLGTFPAR